MTYDLYLCPDDDKTSVPQGQVSFTATNLAAGTTHYWKVVATDGTDSTDSETRSFPTKETEPARIHLLAKGGLAPPFLSWYSVPRKNCSLGDLVQ